MRRCTSSCQDAIQTGATQWHDGELSDFSGVLQAQQKQVEAAPAVQQQGEQSAEAAPRLPDDQGAEAAPMPKLPAAQQQDEQGAEAAPKLPAQQQDEHVWASLEELANSMPEDPEDPERPVEGLCCLDNPDKCSPEEAAAWKAGAYRAY